MKKLLLMVFFLGCPFTLIASAYTFNPNQDTIMVDYDQSLGEMILTGGFGYVHEDIHFGNFQYHFENQHGVRCYETMLLEKTRPIWWKLIDQEFEKFGFESSNIVQLIAFAKAYPDFVKSKRYISDGLGYCHLGCCHFAVVEVLYGKLVLTRDNSWGSYWTKGPRLYLGVKEIPCAMK